MLTRKHSELLIQSFNSSHIPTCYRQLCLSSFSLKRLYYLSLILSMQRRAVITINRHLYLGSCLYCSKCPFDLSRLLPCPWYLQLILSSSLLFQINHLDLICNDHKHFSISSEYVVISLSCCHKSFHEEFSNVLMNIHLLYIIRLFCWRVLIIKFDTYLNMSP